MGKRKNRMYRKRGWGRADKEETQNQEEQEAEKQMARKRRKI